MCLFKSSTKNHSSSKRKELKKVLTKFKLDKLCKLIRQDHRSKILNFNNSINIFLNRKMLKPWKFSRTLSCKIFSTIEDLRDKLVSIGDYQKTRLHLYIHRKN